MSVHQFMQTEVVTLQADEPLLNAVEATTAERVRYLPILEGKRLVGIISDRDIKRACPSAVVEGNKDEYEAILNQTPVRRIMRRAPITAGPDAGLADVVRLMLENRIGAVPILDGNELVGIITETDVLKAFLTLLTILK